MLRLSEALSQCREPEDLTKILSEELGEFLEFLQFYILVYKENSDEVEWAIVGRERNLVAVYADVPVQQRPSRQAYVTQKPFHIHDWNTDERVPARLKAGIAAQVIKPSRGSSARKHAEPVPDPIHESYLSLFHLSSLSLPVEIQQLSGFVIHQ